MTDLPRTFRKASTLEATETQWLWSGRIPIGAVTLLDGDPAAGKSTVTYDIAARVTQGTTMPMDEDASEPAGVVIVQAEDDLGSAVRPRLESAGADLDRVLVYDRESAVGEPLTLPEDGDLLAAAVQEVGAKLMVIDPLSAFLSHGTTSEHRARRALEPLIAIAAKYELAIVAVRHLTKSGGPRALRRGLGSMGVIAAARSGLIVARDPLSNDPARRVLAVSKDSLGSAPSLSYRTSERDDGILGIEWLEESPQHADEVAGGEAEPSALEEAVLFLREVLSEGPVPAVDVLDLASNAAISERTLRRAKTLLHVKSRPQGGGIAAQWFWHPPAGLSESTTNQNRSHPDVPVNRSRADVVGTIRDSLTRTLG